jgi:hypothetical protein
MNSARARIDRETGSLRLQNDGKGLYFRPVLQMIGNQVDVKRLTFNGQDSFRTTASLIDGRARIIAHCDFVSQAPSRAC